MESEYLIIWYNGLSDHKVWLTEQEIGQARNLYNNDRFEELETT